MKKQRNEMEKEIEWKKKQKKKYLNPNIIALNAWPARNFCPGKN